MAKFNRFFVGSQDDRVVCLAHRLSLTKEDAGALAAWLLLSSGPEGCKAFHEGDGAVLLIPPDEDGAEEFLDDEPPSSKTKREIEE